MTEATTNNDSKAKTVIGDMDQRRVFDSVDAATDYITKCQEEFSDFALYPVAAVGLTDEGEFDPEVYTDDMRVAVSVLTKRGNTADNPTDSTVVHCIAIYPAPTMAAILGLPEGVELANKQGLEWLDGIMEKELNHVAVRQLRKAADAQEIAEAVDQMPASVADYTTSSRESTGGILETYNQTWQVIKKSIAKKSKAFALRNFSKKELRKAMESASYASAVYPTIEDRLVNGEKQSLFVVAAQLGQLLAQQESLDPAIYDRALAHRDEKEIEVADDEADFDLEAMVASLTDDSSEDAEDSDEGEEANSEG